MARFPLFTSIKPPANSDELTYLQECLTSWRDAGFNPISVNGPREIATLAALDLPAEFAPLSNDGKPRIGAILMAIKSRGVPFAGIINSDCRVINYPGLDIAANLAGQLALAWRLDIDDKEEPQAYRFGFDAFFFDVNVLPTDDCGLHIGEPWWDLWFPLACERNGAVVGTIMTPLLTHKTHATKWVARAWVENGRRIWTALGKRGTPDLAEWAQDTMAKFHATEYCLALNLTPEITSILKTGGRGLLKASAEAQVTAMRNSLSWRITAPLRKARTLAAQLTNAISIV